MSSCHLLAISLHPLRRLRGSSLVDARGEPRLECVMAGSPVAVRLWWRGRPIVLVSKLEAMGGDEREGRGKGGGWVQVYKDDGFSTSALRARIGTQLIRFAGDSAIIS